jgi:uncharacterized protein (TIGR02246 family)
MQLPAALLVAFFIIACGGQPRQVGKPAVEPVPVDVARAIEGAVEQYRQAFEVVSPEALGELYTHDLDVVMVHQGRAHLGWSQIAAAQRQRFQDVTKARMVISSLSIQALGEEVAVATANLESTIGDDATTTTEKGVVTLVFRKVEDRWMVVSEHFSYPTGAS